MWSFLIKLLEFLTKLLECRRDISLLLQRIGNFYQFSPRQWLAVSTVIIPTLALAFFLATMFLGNSARQKLEFQKKSAQQELVEQQTKNLLLQDEIDRAFSPGSQQQPESAEKIRARAQARANAARQWEAELQSDATPSRDWPKYLRELQ